MDKPIYNAADPTLQKELKSREKRKDLQAKDDLMNVMSSESGRRVLWNLIEHCNVFSSIWTQSAEIHYRAGRQDVGHYLLKIIQDVDPNGFLLMMKERYKGDK